MSEETLIQSQQVTLTGPEDNVRKLLNLIHGYAKYNRVTVTLTPTSVPDAQGSVTEQSQQKSRQECSGDGFMQREHDLAESNEAHAPKDEPCGNSNHGWMARMQCVLPKGHTGRHQDQVGCWWK